MIPFSSSFPFRKSRIFFPISLRPASL